MEEKQNENQENEENESIDDDLKTYLEEIKTLETDFSDLEDLDFEELQEMQDAITQVKEAEEIGIEQKSENDEDQGALAYQEIKEEMIQDFSDIDEIDFDELREMQQAIESVKQEENLKDEMGEVEASQGVSQELEDKIKQELLKRKEVEEEVITPEKFLEYIKNKRNKIWYHALYFLVFDVEDQTSSKSLLYDVLKEVTSKSAIDPIPEHQFYFGLGYILRLTLNNKKIIRFMSGGKFKVNVNIKSLQELLTEAGEPISTRPIIKEEEKKQMFQDFLKDDFSDI